MDNMAGANILARLRVISRGSFGDQKNVGGGVSELRVFFEPGYRLLNPVKMRQL